MGAGHYDEVYQLTSEERVGTGSYGLDYSYDGVGNRLTDFNGAATTTYSYDEADQLSVVENLSSRTTYSYDENGNTETINAAGSYTTYTWDIENRPTLVELSDGTLNTILYDGDGKRRRYEDSAGVRIFVWDGENILLQTNDAGVTNRDYTYRPQWYGKLVSQSGECHHYDALGSTVLLTDASQDVVASYQYRAFGEQTVVSGSSPNRFTWLGQLGYYRQPDSGDYWVRARVCRPASGGRWTSRDRARDGINWYLYCEARPVLFNDPNGLQRGSAGPAPRLRACRLKKPPAICFKSAFEAYAANSAEGGYEFGPKKACDRANALCKSHKACRGCGPTTPKNYKARCWPKSVLNTAMDIHEHCGPRGADKVSHCWAFCRAVKCGGSPLSPMSPLRDLVAALEEAYNRLGERRPDPQQRAEHRAANRAGTECGRRTGKCFDCCVEATYDIPSN